MQIKDLKPKQGSVDILVDVVDIGPIRQFEKFGKPGRVATAIAKDETGDVKLSLWNDEIDKVKAGDKVQVTNGYANEWQGEIQLTAGRMGKLEVIGKAPAAEKKADEIITNAPRESLDDFDESLNVDEENIDDEI